MASEAAPNVNGVYDGQYNQPAELAASVPSQGPPSQPQSSSSTQQKADPQEIGWYFVEQYYTTLSKTPERIHLFYSKKSQLVTGAEAEKVVPAVGSRAISEKIKSLDIQDCKVRVLNVDSQSSFENIVVQVIGELSSKSQANHKFVQTFVLATQPNGYFVLNDIFRYLNDEEDEIIEDQPAQDAAPAAEPAPEVEEPAENKATEVVVDNEAAAQAVDEKLQETTETPAVVEEQESTYTETEADETEPPAEASAEAHTVNEVVTAPPVEQPAEPEPTPIAETPPKSSTEAQPAKKTWASLVGNKAPAIPALPATAAPAGQPKTSRPAQQTATPKSGPEAASGASTATSAAAAATPAAAAATPAVPPPAPPAAASTTSTSTATPTSQNNGWQTAEHSKKAKTSQQKAGDGIVHAYIKNVTEKVDARILREVLEKFGELKYFDVSRPRNCAFVEFADPAGYAAAVSANPHDVGGESIVVEERRPRPGQFNSNNTNFSRGGSAPGRGRGAVQGRAGNQGNFQKEGRGGFTQRGGKSGNVTPKGRGQAQAT